LAGRGGGSSGGRPDVRDVKIGLGFRHGMQGAILLKQVAVVCTSHREGQ